MTVPARSKGVVGHTALGRLTGTVSTQTSALITHADIIGLSSALTPSTLGERAALVTAGSVTLEF